jgi:Mg2+ and Co2+ transporter CorA
MVGVVMSDADGTMLSDRDRQVLGESGVDPEPVDGSETDPGTEYVTLEEFEAYQDAIAKRLSRFEDRLSELEEGDVGDATHDDAPVIEKYATKVENGETDIFQNQRSLRRAVEIHRNWERWKQKFGAGGNWNWGISTAQKSNRKHKPMEIKVDLEDSLAEALEAVEVHRAMKMLAKKSFIESDDEIDEYRDDGNRLHITGGEYEYHQKTSPDNTVADIKHVVVRA